ncbi:MAG: hypothetical protein CVV02_14320 [Firmicutes bacterium HGW-Firmicutes-7]|nr:MAG: hypothetical protein CVV02_14320 [Firmicutes bacterium HGW-Firmicutes-7]
MNDVNYWSALVAGIITFFLPCILPLLPVYFGYLAGEAITNLDSNKIKTRLMINAVGFVLGITLLNVMLGFGARAITKPLMAYQGYLRAIGGVIMILFGAYFVSGFKWMFFERERKIRYNNYSPSFIKSFILGITFSFGWSPCYAPIVGNILIISSFEHNYFRAGTLMLVYSLGFGTMFLLSAFLAGLFVKNSKKIYPYLNIIKRVAGVIMIIMGLLLLTNRLSLLNINY